MNETTLGLSAILLAITLGLFGIFSRRLKATALVLLTALVIFLIWYAFTAPFKP